MSAPRVLIFGTGSLGACYAWVLSRVLPASHITAVCRSNYEEARRNGFTINSELWGNNLNVRPRVSRTVSDAVRQLRLEQQQQQQQQDTISDTASSSPSSCFDYVIVATKAVPTTPTAAELIAPAVVPGRTAIVLLQNGIGIEATFAARFQPANAVLSAVAYLPATRVGPTVVRHTEVERLEVGTYPSTAPAAHREAAERFVALLGTAGATARLRDDIQRSRWAKLLVNASWNPVCALTRLRDRQFLDATSSSSPSPPPSSLGGVQDGGEDDGRQFIEDVMHEIAAVARARGYTDVDAELVTRQASRAAARDPPGVEPSMLADALQGRTLEVEAIVGNVVRMARQERVPVPMLRTVYFLAKGLNEGIVSRAKAAAAAGASEGKGGEGS
ncbi:6-phosphogluconate dehydrogenase C-terminal domain-like protein [Durotheca rogersii]|uniref:6-phosphogluconate dehydrogenase C-terminal domain-like protein n=1 Tax=Durotheca rogersii TaxID=419775 RepID=UPI0022207CCD|nr:6-phosphogluconate dehydrogenase C-terminal domain-like protein [Durotheca rogersii]KAI5863350.1 6-phosphogluconate dehydrogenase C-terminal domain-like protein [Durotheca rogersii]